MNTLRIFFNKTGEAAYISHLDLQRVFSRALRISGLPVWYSQGFNPHIYMSFALPLPLGCESLCECVDVKTESDEKDFGAFVAPLSAGLPRGIEVTAIRPPVHAAGQIATARYRFAWPGAGAAVAAACRGYNALEAAMVLRKTKRSEQMTDLKEVLKTLEPCGQDDEAFEAALPAGGTLNFSPMLLSGFMVEEFGLPNETVRTTRLKVLTADGDALK